MAFRYMLMSMPFLHLLMWLLLLPPSANSKHTVHQADRRMTPQWTTWGAWQSCSRTCGVGVALRTRRCFIEIGSRRRLDRGCVGLYKQHKICNTQPCPSGDVDVWQEQCDRFNSKPFMGRFYKWKSLDMGRSQCKLYCQPHRFNFYAKLADKVTDGTPCYPSHDIPPNVNYVCVAGQCQRVGCDGVVGSQLKLDNCGECGGKNEKCHIVSGIFMRQKLPAGYSKVTVIPTGACNINITELHPSHNYLALRESTGRYIINGHWNVMYNNKYPAVGTVFKYYRPLTVNDTVSESITAKGPITSSVDIMIFKQSANKGIMYHYTIPTAAKNTSAVTSQKNPSKRPSKQPARTVVVRPAVVKGNLSVPLTDQLQSDDVQYSDSYRTFLNKARRPQQLHDVASQNAPARPHGNVRPETSPSSSHRYRTVALQTPKRAQSNERRAVADKNKNPVKSRKQHRRRHRTQVRPGGSTSGAGAFGGERRSAVGRRRGGNSYDAQLRAYRIRLQQQAQRKQLLEKMPGTRSPRQPYHYYGNLPGYIPPVFGSPVPSVGIGLPVRTVQASQPFVGQPQPAVAPYPIPVSGASYAMPQGYTSMVGQPRVPYQAPATAPRVVYVAQAPNQPLQGSGVPLVVKADPYQQHMGVQPLQAPSVVREQQSVALSSGQKRRVNLSTPSDYSWKISGFTKCSRSCGGGTQDTVIVCVLGSSQAIVTDDNCDSATKPKKQSIQCRRSPCPPAWTAGNWSSCSTSCGQGQQTRVVECQQRISPSLAVSVSASRCQSTDRLVNMRTCNDDRPCVTWKVGPWGKCSVECGQGIHLRQVICVNADEKTIPENMCSAAKPKTNKPCDMGSCSQTWFYSPWSTECSANCGEGVYTRKVYCGSDDEKCITTRRPITQKPCKNKTPCGGLWFAGPWSKCSTSCGRGVVHRDVVCVKKLAKQLLTVVGDENCMMTERPITEQRCESLACMPQWYTTDWSRCSKSCGVGVKTREIKCMDETQQVATGCLTDNRPETQQQCNIMPCPARIQTDHQMPVYRSQHRDVKIYSADQVAAYSQRNGPGRSQTRMGSGDSNTQTKSSSASSHRQPSDSSYRRSSDRSYHRSSDSSYSQSRSSAASRRSQGRKTPSSKKPATAVSSDDGVCKDKYKNCILVLQARLCRSSYYRNICCHSCATQATLRR